MESKFFISVLYILEKITKRSMISYLFFLVWESFLKISLIISIVFEK